MENKEKKEKSLKLSNFFPRFLLVALFLIGATMTFAQGKSIKGVVLDQNSEPIIGANVLVEGTTNGAITDLDGNFSLTNVASTAKLRVSYIGYITQVVPVAGNSTFKIQLKEDAKALDEVVVVGYGVQKKSDVTGAITSVNEKTLKERPVQNAISAMQGKAAGVDIQSNVRPGETSAVVIRGNRSIKASNAPLYVVDGVVLMGDVNDINPGDIESIEILKDASSTAIYGSRGANGVVLVTTKSGKSGKVQVDYNMTISADVANSITDWASAGEMLDRIRTAEINGGTYKLGTTVLTEPNLEADISKFGHGDAASIAALQKAYEGGTYDSSKIPTTDWIGMMTRTGITQNHQLSISAGNEKSKLFTSLGYYNAKGVQLNQGFYRYTARINGEIKVTNWLNVGTSISASYSEQEYGTMNYSGSATGARDLYGRALTQYLIAKPYDEDGNLVDYPGGNASAPVWNPYIDLDNTSDNTRRVNLQANAFAEITFTPWLKYRFNLGTNYNNVKEGSWVGSQSTINRKGNPAYSSASNESQDRKNWLIENILFFNKEVGIHSFGATLVQSAQKSMYENLSASANKILYDSSKWWNLASNLNGKPSSYGSGFSENSLMSYMGRVNYGLMNRYLVTASLRYDGASVLATGNKWDYFPSVALAWKMQEEKFIKSIQWIDELKLRLGYGVTGNSAVSAYTTSGPLSQYNYVYGTTPAIGMIPKDMANKKLGWEKTRQINIGLDFAVLNRRLSGTLEWYQSNTFDLLMDRSIPGITGFSNVLDNIGEMKNSGIELSLSSVNIDKRDFTWRTDLNISHNKEEIVSLVNGKQDMPSNGWFIGQPLSVYRYYIVDGLWQNTPEDLAEIAEWKKNGYNFAPGQYKPKEVNKNYKLEDDDKQIVGNRSPKVVIGLTNTFNYKNWELSFFLYGRLGQKYYYNIDPNASGDYVVYGRKASLNDFWSEENPNAKYPKLTSASNVSDANVNRSANVHNGSFVSVRNISLGYTFKDKLLSKYSIRSLNVFAQVINPFLFGGEVVKAGINPEDTNNLNSFNSVGDLQGATNNNTMMTTSFVFGLRLGF
ncbi:MAG: SusC/RagA family TonB-linked outer membrane protein [Bacteroides graminisolvens]|jgi:Outer membrane cobalamin receptor protein|uniref:SusC/RagA family TonB-linked outer membrane protein n=1 Tax=Bacteroides graminisolvens TaxID=477666 RepID=UPI003A88E54B